MQTILIKNGEVKKKQVALLEFLFDHQVIALVRTIPDAKWQPELKAWAIPYSETLINELLSIFKGKAWLDYSAFKKVKLQPKFAALPNLSGELKVEISKFTDWMRNRRYSESTIKNYNQGIGLFFRFMENKNPEQITNEDLELFNKDYIISRQYSASFQSGVINAVKLFFSNRLKRKLEPELIERPKQPKILPHVLPKDEIEHDTLVKLVLLPIMRDSMWP